VPPADGEMRTFYVVYTAYLALSPTDPALAIKGAQRTTGVHDRTLPRKRLLPIVELGAGADER